PAVLAALYLALHSDIVSAWAGRGIAVLASAARAIADAINKTVFMVAFPSMLDPKQMRTRLFPDSRFEMKAASFRSGGGLQGAVR
ncbi:MAG TPA: hypothetical protein VHY10_18515, partial [Xanthobacteraceae bacterium]|nr:hypothetical protein [Xanthobacteraceae bacterium]